jgi:hypothetical protein
METGGKAFSRDFLLTLRHLSSRSETNKVEDAFMEPSLAVIPLDTIIPLDPRKDGHLHPSSLLVQIGLATPLNSKRRKTLWMRRISRI